MAVESECRGESARLRASRGRGAVILTSRLQVFGCLFMHTITGSRGTHRWGSIVRSVEVSGLYQRSSLAVNWGLTQCGVKEPISATQELF